MMRDVGGLNPVTSSKKKSEIDVVIAVGVGCRRGVAADDLVALVREALATLGEASAPVGIFTIAEKRDEAGLHEAARALELPLAFLDRAVLAMVASATRSCSRRVEDMFGLPGIAETAALAGAGSGAALLVPRLASATVTCAVAGRLG